MRSCGYRLAEIQLSHDRERDHLRRAPLRNDASCAHDRKALAELCHEWDIVLDDEQGDVALGIDADEEITQLCGLGLGNPGDRLVQHYEARLGDEGARAL